MPTPAEHEANIRALGLTVSDAVITEAADACRGWVDLDTVLDSWVWGGAPRPSTEAIRVIQAYHAAAPADLQIAPARRAAMEAAAAEIAAFMAEISRRFEARRALKERLIMAHNAILAAAVVGFLTLFAASLYLFA